MSTLKDRIAEILSDCGGKSKDIEKINEKSRNILGEYDKLVRGFHGLFQIRDEMLGRIMDEIDKEQKILRPALRWFAGEMEEDLRRNDFKGGWLDGRLDYYWGKAYGHLAGLRPVDSLKIVGKKHAIDRCVKSANYMMMIAHNLIEELRIEMEKKGEK